VNAQHNGAGVTRGGVSEVAAALTPTLISLRSAALPNASTFCGRCVDVCPVKIPLTDIMRRWRHREHQEKLSSPARAVELMGAMRAAPAPVSFHHAVLDPDSVPAWKAQKPFPVFTFRRRLDTVSRFSGAGILSCIA
jgi:L-lactate utilization protein LutB